MKGNWKHGYCAGGKSPTWKLWRDMRNRCENPNNRNFKHYGLKGVAVCERWQRFENFLSDMGERPLGPTEFSLDRIDNAKGYEPSNCRWATNKQQSNNQTRNHIITVYGERLTLAQVAEKYKVKAPTIRARIKRYGWSEEKAATFPGRSWNKKTNNKEAQA